MHLIFCSTYYNTLQLCRRCIISSWLSLYLEKKYESLMIFNSKGFFASVGNNYGVYTEQFLFSKLSGWISARQIYCLCKLAQFGQSHLKSNLNIYAVPESSRNLLKAKLEFEGVLLFDTAFGGILTQISYNSDTSILRY